MQYLLHAAPLTAALIGIYLTSLYGYLLFHSLAEVFSIAIASGIFMISWNARRLLQNHFLLFVGIAYLYVGGIDLLHMLAFKGMGVFQGYGANLPTQLWIAARYMEAFSLMLATIFLHKRIYPRVTLIVFGALTALLLGSIFHWKVFPDCFIEGVGLTPFKIYSEYLICLIFVVTAGLLVKHSTLFDRKVLALLLASIATAIAQELAFTNYLSVYGPSNMAGHLLKIISFYLIYKAIIETSLVSPCNLLFRELKQSEAKFRNIFETNVVPIAYCHTDGRIIDANSDYLMLLGYTREELVAGEARWDVATPPEWQQVDKNTIDYLRENGTCPPLEKEYIRRDGTRVPVLFGACLVPGESEQVVAFAVDLTERKRMEQALRESEERLRLFIEHAPASLAMFDRSMRYLSVSRRWKHDYNLGERDLTGLSHYEVFPEISPEWKAVHRRALAGEVVRAESDQFVRADGWVQWLRWEARPWRDASGDVGGIVVFTEDTTARKLAEDAVRDSEQQLRTLGDNLPQGAIYSYVHDAEGRPCFEYISAGIEQLTGVKPAEIMRDPGTLHGTVLPEDYARLIETEADSRRTLCRFELEVRQRHRVSGEIRWALLRSVPRRMPDGSTIWDGVHLDITERKRMEEELRSSRDELELRVQERTADLIRANEDLQTKAALLNLAHDAIIVRGMDNKIVFWNPGAERLYGFTAEQALGKVSNDLLQTEAPEDLGSILEKVTGTGRWEGELKHTCSRGQKIIVESRWALQPGQDGKPAGVLEINRNITARKAAEEALKTQMARLELVNTELQGFAFAAAHDLQEPLRKIQTFCDMAKTRCASVLDATSQEYLQRVLNSADRMRRLLYDLLEFSRVASEPEPLKELNLRRIVQEAADVFEATLRETGGLVEIGEMPVIRSDETQMSRLFQNLIGNALKYRSDRPPHISIHSRQNSEGTCEIYVRDNGIGFEQQYAEKIFKPFQRLHGRSEYDGTGMGLTICRKIVERQGGSIRAESKPGEGTTFIISLQIDRMKMEDISARVPACYPGA